MRSSLLFAVFAASLSACTPRPVTTPPGGRVKAKPEEAWVFKGPGGAGELGWSTSVDGATIARGLAVTERGVLVLGDNERLLGRGRHVVGVARVHSSGTTDTIPVRGLGRFPEATSLIAGPGGRRWAAGEVIRPDADAFNLFVAHTAPGSASFDVTYYGGTRRNVRGGLLVDAPTQMFLIGQEAAGAVVFALRRRGRVRWETHLAHGGHTRPLAAAATDTDSCVVLSTAGDALFLDLLTADGERGGTLLLPPPRSGWSAYEGGVMAVDGDLWVVCSYAPDGSSNNGDWVAYRGVVSLPLQPGAPVQWSVLAKRFFVQFGTAGTSTPIAGGWQKGDDGRPVAAFIDLTTGAVIRPELPYEYSTALGAARSHDGRLLGCGVGGSSILCIIQ